MIEKENDIDFNNFIDYAKEQKESSKNVGIAISFVTGNKILLEEGIGYRDLSKNCHLHLKQSFPLGRIQNLLQQLRLLCL